MKNWTMKHEDIEIYCEEHVSRMQKNGDALYLFSFVSTFNNHQIAGHVFEDSMDFTKINYSVVNEEDVKEFIGLVAATTTLVLGARPTFIRSTRQERKVAAAAEAKYKEKY